MWPPKRANITGGLCECDRAKVGASGFVVRCSASHRLQLSSALRMLRYLRAPVAYHALLMVSQTLGLWSY